MSRTSAANYRAGSLQTKQALRIIIVKLERTYHVNRRNDRQETYKELIGVQNLFTCLY